MSGARPEEDTVRDDDRRASAGLEEAEEEGEEEQLGLLRLHVLEQGLGRRLVVEAAWKGGFARTSE